MNVVGFVIWKTDIDHERKTFDIDTSSSHIGTDQEVDSLILDKKL